MYVLALLCVYMVYGSSGNNSSSATAGLARVLMFSLTCLLLRLVLVLLFLPLLVCTDFYCFEWSGGWLACMMLGGMMGRVIVDGDGHGSTLR